MWPGRLVAAIMAPRPGPAAGASSPNPPTPLHTTTTPLPRASRLWQETFLGLGGASTVTRRAEALQTFSMLGPQAQSHRASPPSYSFARGPPRGLLEGATSVRDEPGRWTTCHGPPGGSYGSYGSGALWNEHVREVTAAVPRAPDGAPQRPRSAHGRHTRIARDALGAQHIGIGY